MKKSIFSWTATLTLKAGDKMEITINNVKLNAVKLTVMFSANNEEELLKIVDEAAKELSHSEVTLSAVTSTETEDSPEGKKFKRYAILLDKKEYLV